MTRHAHHTSSLSKELHTVDIEAPFPLYQLLSSLCVMECSLSGRAIVYSIPDSVTIIRRGFHITYSAKRLFLAFAERLIPDSFHMM